MERSIQRILAKFLNWYLSFFYLPDISVVIRSSQTDIDAQVTEAIESIQKTSNLVSELERNLKERTSQLERIRQDHEKYSQLAQIEASKAEAILSQIEATVGRDRKKERWIAFGINIAAGVVMFILGVALSDSLKELLAWLCNLVVK
jgi:hypothetical protein